MRLLRSLIVIAVLFPGSGCLLLTGARNLFVEPIASYTLECLEAKRNEALAISAWKSVVEAHPDMEFSLHYAEGFRQGFVDYLNAGGTGAPPPLPPRKYWGVRYETPEGHAAMQDWFAGFRHGAETAAQSGYRNFVVLPTSVPPTDPLAVTRPRPRETAPGEVSVEPIPVPPTEIPKPNE